MADAAFVRALNTSKCYDFVLATGYYPLMSSVLAPDGADIPEAVLEGALGLVHPVLRQPNSRKHAVLAFWPKSHRLRLIGIQSAVAAVEAVLRDEAGTSQHDEAGTSQHDEADTWFLGYPTKEVLVWALVTMVGSHTDVGSKYHWDGVGLSSSRDNPMLSSTWYDNNADNAPMTARLLAIVLAVFIGCMMESEV
ncbi:hypothetical protein SPRG_18322, partial [Saprolegnia parasitica CBS 223.65]